MRVIIKFFLVFLILTVAVISYEYQRFSSTTISLDTPETIFTVEPGQNLLQISNKLTMEGLSVFPPYYLYLYGRAIKQSHLVKAGQYTVLQTSTLPDLLQQFIEGKVVQHSFTIVEGMTAQMLIDKVLEDKRFKRTIENSHLSSVMAMLGKAEQHGEGEFAPETYYFQQGTSDADFLLRAHNLMTETLAGLWQKRADNLPYKSPYEALIMASIIEKETGIAEERPEIAGVFIRRLHKGMRLQTDPTVIYGLGDKFNGNLKRKHLTSDTAYNTYTRHGLPPTPIALPSKEAIEAALNPKDGKTLYFVATGKEGRHYFSKTLKEHNKAVRKYQLKKK